MGKGPDKPKPTAQEKAAGKVAVEQWNEYATNWHKPIMTWAQGIRKDSAHREARATGIAGADLAQQTAGAERRLAAGGMNPNSGKGFGAIGEAADLSAEAGAGARVSARQGVEDARLFGMQQVANIGMGQKAEAVQGIGEIAERSTRESIGKALDSFQRRQDTASFIGGMAGVAAEVGRDLYDQGKTKPYTDAQGGQYQQNGSGVRVKSVLP